MKTIKSLLTLTVLGAVGFLSASSLSKTQKKEDSVVVLSADNTVVLASEVTGQSVGEVLTKAKELDNSGSLASKVGLKNKKPIYLFLSTPGGSIQAGLELIQGLQGLNRPISTVTNFAASMGFQIVQGLGERLILKNGVLMSHRAAGGIEGEFGGTRPSQLDSRYNFWLSRLNEMDQQTVDRTKGKQTLASYQKEYATEMWLTGTQSVNEGYADRVISLRCDSTLSGVTTKSINFMGLSISYDLDNCPLNSAPMNIRVNIATKDGRKLPLSNFLAEGGSFGQSCYDMAVTDKKKVCALDTSLTLEKVTSVADDFRTSVLNANTHVVPMKW